MARIMKSETVTALGTGRKDYSENADNNIVPVIRSHQIRYRWGGELFNVDPLWWPIGVALTVNVEYVAPYTYVYEMPDDTYYIDGFNFNTDRNGLIKIEFVEYANLADALADLGPHVGANVLAAVYGFSNAEIKFDASIQMRTGKVYAAWLWPHGEALVSQTTSFALNAYGLRDIVVQR